jgi:hypothetical protein
MLRRLSSFGLSALAGSCQNTREAATNLATVLTRQTEEGRRPDSSRQHELGQFLTPNPVADFMASLFDTLWRELHLLDARRGCRLAPSYHIRLMAHGSLAIQRTRFDDRAGSDSGALVSADLISNLAAKSFLMTKVQSSCRKEYQIAPK